jgi:hypothetical protein
MDINEAKQVIVRTHMGALHGGTRASAIEMISPPGIGKSSAVVQCVAETARQLGEPVGLHVFMFATISSVDVRGFMIPIKGAADNALDTVFSTPPWYPTISNTVVIEPDGTVHREGTWKGQVPRVGVLFLDEFGQADDDVRKAGAELLLNGQVGNVALPMGWRVVAASNRMKDRSGVMRPLMFLTNRRMEVHIDANMPAFIGWASSQPKALRPHHMTLSFAQQYPQIVFTDGVPDGTDPFCTPRSLCRMDADLRSLRSPEEVSRDQMPMDTIAKECAAGWVGQAAASQYFVHLKFSDEIPTIESVMRDPSKAKLPPNKDAQMVVGFMLAGNIDDKNAEPVMKYLTRLKTEMQVLAVRAMKGRPEASHALSMTADYADWLREHKDLLLAVRA